MSTLKVDTVQSRTGSAISIGTSGDTVTVPTGVTLNTTNAAVTLPDVNNYPPFRNIVINGDMSVSQRGTSFTGLTGTSYTLDRWRWTGFTDGSVGTFTVTQDTTVPTGQGFAKSLKADCTTAQASPTGSNSLVLKTRFEGQNLQYLKKGTSSAESTTLSFWVRSNKTGTYVAELEDNDNTRHIAKTYTISAADTWEKKTIIFEGDTTGAFTSDNNLSLTLGFYLVVGPDISSGTLATSWASLVAANRAAGQTVNIADNTANEWYITGVQLEVGDSATPFEFLPYDVNLQRCYRYCQKWIPNSGSTAMRLGNGAIMDTQNMYFVAFPSVEMRTKPSLTLNSTTDWRIFHRGLTATTTNLTFETHGTNQVFNFLATVSSGLTSGDCGQLIGNSTSNYALFDAEL